MLQLRHTFQKRLCGATMCFAPSVHLQVKLLMMDVSSARLWPFCEKYIFVEYKRKFWFDFEKKKFDFTKMGNGKENKLFRSWQWSLIVICSFDASKCENWITKWAKWTNAQGPEGSCANLIEMLGRFSNLEALSEEGLCDKIYFKDLHYFSFVLTTPSKSEAR